MEGFGLLGAILVIFFIFLAILWCLLPFLIMGTNGRLDKLIARQAEMSAQLQRLADALAPAEVPRTRSHESVTGGHESVTGGHTLPGHASDRQY